MSQSSEFKVVPSFKQLNEMFSHLKLEVPEVPRLDPKLLQDPSKLEEAVKEKTKKAKELQREIQEALRFLSTMKEWLISTFNGDSLEESIRKEAGEPIIDGVNEYLDKCLSHEDPLFRMIAAKEYLFYHLSRVETLPEVKETLKDLCQKKILIPDQNGVIFIDYQRYSLGSQFGKIDAEGKKAIEKAIADFSRKSIRLVMNERENKKKDMEDQATIKPEEFFQGKEGVCLLEVPPEFSKGKNGESFWRGGGNLLLQLKKGKIMPKAGTGCMETLVTEMKDIGVELDYHTLEWEAPPGTGKAFDRVKEAISHKRGLSIPLAEKYLRKVQALWHILQRTKRNLLEKEALEKIKEEICQRATITAEEFFGLGGPPAEEGIVFLQMKGFFKEKDKKRGIPNPFCLIERTKEAGDKALVVLEVYPEEAKVLFSLNKKFKEGENFSGLPWSLRRFLEAVKGQTDLGSEIAKE